MASDSSSKPVKLRSAAPRSAAADATRRPKGKTKDAKRAAETKSQADHADRGNAVVQFVRNLFVRQVKLERKGGDFHLVLQEPTSTQPGHSVPVAVPSSVGEAKPTHAALLGISSNQLKRMRHQLSAVLDLHPSTRSVFPHLNYLDKSLRRHGADCFRDLPVEVLHKALIQLDSLVQGSQPGPVGLAELRACLVVSAVDRGAPEDDADADGQGEPSGLSSSLSDFNVSGKLSVNEVSHSDFMKANQQWETAGETIKLKT